jgi:hypothetical protein
MAAAPRQARSSSLVLREVTDAVASMPVPPIEQMVLGAAPSWPTATTAKNMLDVLAGAILKLKTTSPTAAPRYAYVAPKGVTGVGQATRRECRLIRRIDEKLGDICPEKRFSCLDAIVPAPARVPYAGQGSGEPCRRNRFGATPMMGRER